VVSLNSLSPRAFLVFDGIGNNNTRCDRADRFIDISQARRYSVLPKRCIIAVGRASELRLPIKRNKRFGDFVT
jgi:hypothetical protein